MKIVIYVIYNPVNSEIRYIGRTKSPLIKRLQQHLCKSRKHYSNSYKENWIRSLLKNGITPRIRKLVELDCSWKESHIFEKNLIEKHLVKHKLVNGDDRGPGKLSKNIDKTTEKLRVARIKEHFNKEENKINFYNKVYCYDERGIYLKTYTSSKHAVEDLKISYNTLLNHKNRAAKQMVQSINGLHFRNFKVDSIEIYDKTIIVAENIATKEITNFDSMLGFASHFNLGHWDLHQYRLGKKTARLKDVEKYFLLSPLQW